MSDRMQEDFLSAANGEHDWVDWYTWEVAWKAGRKAGMEEAAEIADLPVKRFAWEAAIAIREAAK